MNSRNVLISAGIGGVTMGILSSLPIIGLANCVLCLWVWLGGALAVVIYSRTNPTLPSNGQGAAIGALAGLVGAVVFSGTSLLLGAVGLGFVSMMGEATSDEMIQILTMGGIGIAARFAASLLIGPGIGALAGVASVSMRGMSL